MFAYIFNSAKDTTRLTVAALKWCVYALPRLVFPNPWREAQLQRLVSETDHSIMSSVWLTDTELCALNATVKKGSYQTVFLGSLSTEAVKLGTTPAQIRRAINTRLATLRPIVAEFDHPKITTGPFLTMSEMSRYTSVDLVNSVGVFSDVIIQEDSVAGRFKQHRAVDLEHGEFRGRWLIAPDKTPVLVTWDFCARKSNDRNRNDETIGFVGLT